MEIPNRTKDFQLSPNVRPIHSRTANLGPESSNVSISFFLVFATLLPSTMNGPDTQIDVLKFLQGSQLDDAVMLVSRRFKSTVDAHRDLLPLRALFRLLVEVKEAGTSIIYKVTIEDENLPTQLQE